MTIKKVLLLGGSGFIGSYIANRLSNSEVETIIPTRRRERNKKLVMLPGVELPQANINEPGILADLMKGCDAVINLVGILHDSDVRYPYGKHFAAAHIELPEKIIAACRASGVRRLVHMSALNADPQGPSEYLRSKGEGEARVKAAVDLDVTVFRPSVVFGAGDSFLTAFARLLPYCWFFPVGGANARFQPVCVTNVADAFIDCLERRETFGKTYDLAGPGVYTLRELITYTGKLSGAPRPVVGLPDGLAYLQAGILSFLPDPPMSPDNLRSMEVDNVTSGNNNYPGWRPTPLEAVAPSYLGRHKPAERMNAFRLFARR